MRLTSGHRLTYCESIFHTDFKSKIVAFCIVTEYQCDSFRMIGSHIYIQKVENCILLCKHFTPALGLGLQICPRASSAMNSVWINKLQILSHTLLHINYLHSGTECLPAQAHDKRSAWLIQQTHTKIFLFNCLTQTISNCWIKQIVYR